MCQEQNETRYAAEIEREFYDLDGNECFVLITVESDVHQEHSVEHFEYWGSTISRNESELIVENQEITCCDVYWGDDENKVFEGIEAEKLINNFFTSEERDSMLMEAQEKIEIN